MCRSQESDEYYDIRLPFKLDQGNDTLEKINAPENLSRVDLDNLTLVYNLLESYGK